MSAVRERAWLREAVLSLEREAARSADTHLLRLDFPGFPGIGFYFKDEASHPSGSLKHRLARSLVLYALCNGRLHEGQEVVDASLREHRDLGGVVRAPARPALHRGDAGLHCAGQDP